MIILIGCGKRWSGKTTIATNIAVGLAMQAHGVVLVDADKQRRSSKWHQYKIEEDRDQEVI